MRKNALSDGTIVMAKATAEGGRAAAEQFAGTRLSKHRNKSLRRLAVYSLLGTAIALALLLLPALAAEDNHRQLVPIQSSTVPSNGDVNPYGVAFVPFGFPGDGALHPGDVLVSNFNNSANQQGTGTTIVKVAPNGQTALFFQGAPPLGLTTALGVLKGGFVLVGNLPTNAGTLVHGQPGSLLVINRHGQQIASISDPVLLDGPWDLTILDGGDWAKVFVSNALNGTVTRLELDVDPDHVFVKQKTQIASGYTSVPNQAALILGPTGLAYNPRTGVLYVASTGDNAIFAIANAAMIGQSQGQGKLVYQDNAHLRGPLALALAPNGHLITANGDAVNASPDPSQNSELVEFTQDGKFVGQFSIDSAAGSAFGIAVVPSDEDAARLAAVDDTRSDLTVFRLNLR